MFIAIPFFCFFVGQTVSVETKYDNHPIITQILFKNTSNKEYEKVQFRFIDYIGDKLIVSRCQENQAAEYPILIFEKSEITLTTFYH